MKHIRKIIPLAILALHQPTFAAEQSASQAEDRRVSLAYINDIHAQLEPHPELFWADGKEDYVLNAGGLSRIATVFKELRAQRPGEMLFIDGGDTIQGSGPAAWTEGKVVVEPMNSLGLDVAIPGNWAVTYGAEVWKARAAEFNYKMVAANMSDDSGKQLFDPYVIKEINGVRLGILGFTEPAIPTRQPPYMSEGLAFQESEVLQPLIDELRNEKKVDLVVVVSHIGLPRAVGHRQGAPEDNIHRVPGCQLIRKVETTTHDAVRAYLIGHSPIPTEGEPNVRCIDCPGIIRSQYLETTKSIPTL